MNRPVLAVLTLWFLMFVFPPSPIAAADPQPTTSVSDSAPKRPLDCAETFAANPEFIKYQAATSDLYRDVHKLATGMGVTVGIIDTGVAQHPRLPPIADGGDFLEPNMGATIDCDAHGTIVAGVIAARDTGDGIVGVAPDASIVSFRQTSSQSKKTDAGGTLATLTTAINAAVDKKVQVINISVVSCLPPGAPPVDTHEFDAAIQRAEAQGIVIVAAAGNVGNNCQQGSVVFPAHHALVVGVTATEDLYHSTEYSIESPQPTISAPGMVHAGLDPLGSGVSSGIVQRNTVLPFEGTSFAAPMVTGTVVLLRQRHPLASAQQIRDMLFASVDPSNGTLDINRTVRYVTEQEPRSQTVVISAQPRFSFSLINRAGWVLGAAVIIGLLFLGIAHRTHRRKA